tara:strand:+ start:8985 stop:9194 length:210 start_codon:yes stop_codon:yes gene_type:complete
MKRNRIQELNDQLIGRLMNDLEDPDKCTPGLYQVVRGVITDNQSAVDNLDGGALDAAVEKIDLPFKFGS